MLAICAAYVVLAIALTPEGFGTAFALYLGLLIQYGPRILAFGLVVVPVLVRPQAPLSLLKDTLRERALPATTIIVVATLTGAAFTALKHQIPEFVPFWADPMLAELDRLIHLGDPWIVAHKIFPEVLSPALGFLYGPFWFMEYLGVIVLMAFSLQDGLRARYLSALTVSFAFLTTVPRTALNSAGPIFYDRLLGGDRFQSLMVTLSEDPAGQTALRVADYLFASYQDQTAVVGGGISAMPSIHVAVAFLNALLASRINRWLGVLAWSYALVVLFGSVYLGWHYATDGYLSIAVVLVTWWVAGRILDTGHTGHVSSEPDDPVHTTV